MTVMTTISVKILITVVTRVLRKNLLVPVHYGIGGLLECTVLISFMVGETEKSLTSRVHVISEKLTTTRERSAHCKPDRRTYSVEGLQFCSSFFQ